MQLTSLLPVIRAWGTSPDVPGPVHVCFFIDRLSRAGTETQLLALDWTQEFDWSPEALDQRVRQAAQCIGWEAVTSQVEDDGHWGGYQLRIPAYMSDGLHYGAIAGGFGFELDAFDVLCLVREHISVRLDEDGDRVAEDDESIEVQPDLLGLLARPFGEMHTRKD